MNKKEIRKIMSEKRNELSQSNVKEKSLEIFKNLITIKNFCDAKQVLSYISIKNEVDTSEIINYCWSTGKNTASPKVMGPEMKFFYFSDYHDLVKGKFNVLEPQTNDKYIYNQEDVIIIPGLAFDTFGGRVGYGGGFYDKYLSKSSPLIKIALAYDFQITDTPIEVNYYDIKPDYIVTEKRIINIR